MRTNRITTPGNTCLLLILLLLFTACVPDQIDETATSVVHLEATVSVLETRVTDLTTVLAQSTASVGAVTPSPSSNLQVTPYTGPLKISAITFAPADDAIYLARTTGIERNQDGIEQTLYTWTEPVPDLLAGFSANGAVVAARMNNGDVSVVGLPQGELLLTLRLHVDYEEWPSSLALSADGSDLAVALGENKVQVWDVNTGVLSSMLTQPGTGVTYQILSFSPDGKVLQGGFLNTITTWNLATGEQTSFDPGCRGDTIFDLAYSPDEKYLAVACGAVDSSVGFLVLWDVIEDEPVFRLEETLQMQRVAFSPDSGWLAAGGPDGAITFWNVTGTREPLTSKSQTTPVYDLVFSPDGNELVYATEGGLGFINLAEIGLP